MVRRSSYDSVLTCRRSKRQLQGIRHRGANRICSGPQRRARKRAVKRPGGVWRKVCCLSDAHASMTMCSSELAECSASCSRSGRHAACTFPSRRFEHGSCGADGGSQRRPRSGTLALSSPGGGRAAEVRSGGVVRAGPCPSPGGALGLDTSKVEVCGALGWHSSALSTPWPTSPGAPRPWRLWARRPCLSTSPEGLPPKPAAPLRSGGVAGAWSSPGGRACVPLGGGEETATTSGYTPAAPVHPRQAARRMGELHRPARSRLSPRPPRGPGTSPRPRRTPSEAPWG